MSSGREKEDEEIPAPNYYVANVEWARDGQSLIFPGWDPEERFGIFRISLRDFRIELLQPGGRRGTGFLGAFINLQWLPLAHAYMFEKIVDMGARAIYSIDQNGRNAKLVADKVPSGLWTWPSPDGKHLAHQEGQELKLWSFGTNAPLASLAQFPKGKPVEGNGAAHGASVWSTLSGQAAW